MSTPENWQALIGTWTGTSRLFLHDEPTRESPTTASVALIAQSKFCTIAYTWLFDGEPQEGQLLFGYDPDGQTVDAVFVDSWHMGDKFMVLQGRLEADTAINVHGSYAVPSGPDWGWRIEVESGGDTMRMAMYNVSPEGEEFLGVEATYTRAA
jgi:hypothetical protein